MRKRGTLTTGMPTPTNSVFTRDVSDDARITQLIYENESLKIELETLKDQLDSVDATRIEDLQSANEALRIENTKLNVQLEETTRQLGLLRNSDTRFSNIDDSLKQLQQHIEAQREELVELRLLGKEKDSHNTELKGCLENAEKELEDARKKSKAQAQAVKEHVERLQSEKDDLAKQLEEATQMRDAETGRATRLEGQLSQREERLRQCEKELLSLKEAAAAKSAVRSDRSTEQERRIADFEQREAASQKAIVTLENELAEVRGKYSKAKEKMHAMVQEHQQALAEAAASRSNSQADPYSPEVKAYVARKVKEAVVDRDRRLQEQVNENASLLSRIALIQHESEAMVKKAGLTGRGVSAMNERVDVMSKARNARSNMERRVADFLSNDTFSKEDVELLLQEMLDYQEKTDEEVSTRLLIKDMQAEEAEKTFRWNLKRLENENASLMKQLQKAAFSSLQRPARTHADERPEGGEGPHNAHTASALGEGTTAVATAAVEVTAGPATATANPPNAAYGYSDGRPCYAPAAGEGTPAHTATPPRQQPYPTGQTPPRPPQHWPSPKCFQDPSVMGQYSPNPNPNYNHNHYGSAEMGQPTPLRPVAHLSPSPNGANSLDPQRNTIVPCPACTYEQKYGNRTCELCDTPLVPPPS